MRRRRRARPRRSARSWAPTVSPPARRSGLHNSPQPPCARPRRLKPLVSALRPVAPPSLALLRYGAVEHSGEASADGSTGVAPPWVTCSYTNQYCSGLGDPLYDVFNQFEVSTHNWPDDPRGCLLGVLDNVRDQTSGAEGSSWQCESEYPNQRHMSFKVSTVYRDAGPRVAKAIQLASPGGALQVDCKYVRMQAFNLHQTDARSCPPPFSP